MTTVAYFIFAGILILFGVITGFSIGLPFLFLGQVLAVLYPVRGKPVFWAVIFGYLAFWAGFILVTPLSCTATAVSQVGSFRNSFEGPGHVICSNLLGIDYSGPMGYSPPRRFAFAAGLGSGSVVGFIVWRVAGRLRRRFRAGVRPAEVPRIPQVR